MASGREDWQSHRQDMQGNRQDWRTSNREDWQHWADSSIQHHGGWYHGCWHGGWYHGSRWNYMWDHYPVASAFGLTVWGVNRVAYGWGYWPYRNPYATVSVTYNYSQPIVVNVPSTDAAQSATPPVPTSQSDGGMTALDEARTAFFNGDSSTALTLLDTAIRTQPNDPVIHEFRSLVLFSLKRYSEAAAAAYAVLSAGPGWDWTTMAGLYSSVEVYTQQLRALEAFSNANPQSSDAHFLLAYHYLTAGYAENAAAQFKAAQASTPDDRLLAQLVLMTDPPEPPPAPRPAAMDTPDVPSEDALTVAKLIGSWKSTRDGAEFQLDLTNKGTFTWTYRRGEDRQAVTGVFAIDQQTLALEQSDGSTMLAEVTFTSPTTFQFQMIGDSEGDPGLLFQKQ